MSITFVALALAVTGCEWATGQPSTVSAGWTEGDVPVVFPMTIDLTDTSVPPEFAADPQWNGQPFSWQCYDPVLAAELGRDLGPQTVEPLKAIISVGEGDFARVSYDAEIEPNDPTSDPNSLCFASAQMVFAQETDGSPIWPRPHCEVYISVNGQPTGHLDESTVGPLSGGANLIDVRTFNCNGSQQGTGRQTLMAEQIAVGASGEAPNPPITTVSTPIEYPVVDP